MNQKHGGPNVDWLSVYGKQHGDVSKKGRTELSDDPAFPLLGIYPPIANTLIQKRYMHIPLYIAALSTMAKIWEQLQSLRADEWIKKL